MAQQQLHLKGYDDVARRGFLCFGIYFAKHVTSHQYTDYVVLWGTNSTVIRDLRPTEVPRILFYETAFAENLTKKKRNRGRN